MPSITTLPEVGRSSPARQCISVDLPEPDGPMIAVSRPAGKSTETPSSARTAASPSPKVRCRSVALTITLVGAWVAAWLTFFLSISMAGVHGRRGVDEPQSGIAPP